MSSDRWLEKEDSAPSIVQDYISKRSCAWLKITIIRHSQKCKVYITKEYYCLHCLLLAYSYSWFVVVNIERKKLWGGTASRVVERDKAGGDTEDQDQMISTESKFKARAPMRKQVMANERKFRREF